MDKTIVHKGKIKEQGNDFNYWQSLPYEERLKVMMEIIHEYNTWKYGSEQRLQRVYRIVKRKRG